PKSSRTFGLKPSISRKTRNECATPNSDANICLSAPASLKLVAKPSSAPVSNNPACSGPCAELIPSSLYAAVISTAALRITGRPAGLLDFHFYVAHPFHTPTRFRIQYHLKLRPLCRRFL